MTSIPVTFVLGTVRYCTYAEDSFGALMCNSFNSFFFVLLASSIKASSNVAASRRFIQAGCCLLPSSGKNKADFMVSYQGTKPPNSSSFVR